ncbi:MAG: hypothetical protein WC539_04590 [Nitrospirota bacterium]
MELSHLQMFFIGFGIATILYFLLSGLAWIESIDGMTQEDAMTIVKHAKGKTWAELMEHDAIQKLPPGHFARMQERDSVCMFPAANAVHCTANPLLSETLTVEKNSAAVRYLKKDQPLIDQNMVYQSPYKMVLSSSDGWLPLETHQIIPGRKDTIKKRDTVRDQFADTGAAKKPSVHCKLFGAPITEYICSMIKKELNAKTTYELNCRSCFRNSLR